MQQYRIIEDASPFYIRFVFDGLSDIIEFVSKQSFLESNCTNQGGYWHNSFDKDVGNQIISMFPMSKLVLFNPDNVSVFDSPPGGGSGIHKDGEANKVSFNIAIEVYDDQCITKWYDDAQFTNMPIIGLPYTRNVYGYDRDIRNLSKFDPIKTMVAAPNEMVIFNTDIFHSWENNSNYKRRVLALRTRNSDKLTFDLIKNLLFGTLIL